MAIRRASSHLARRLGVVSAILWLSSPLVGVGLSAGTGCGGSSGDGPFPDAGPVGDGGDLQRTDAGDAASVDATVGDGSRGDDGGGADAAKPEASAEAGEAEANDAGADSDAPTRPVLEAGACADPFGGGPLTTTSTHLDIGVHDPSMIWDGYQ